MLKFGIIAFVATFAAVWSESSAQGCGQGGFRTLCPYADAENQKDCRKYKEKCCWDGSKCYTKTESSSGTTKQESFSKPSARFLITGFIPPPIRCPKGKDVVPKGCKWRNPQPYVLEPPTDIPYCARIPCSELRTEQNEYEISLRKCGSQPGCYFDKELFELREAFGPGVLPGVPVCHLAIRNTVFQREAQKSVVAAKGWNPYFTYCLLERFNDEITAETDGCKFIDVLLVFGVAPKLAGWEGITTADCQLIGGCWRKDSRCWYPYELKDDLTVKSGQSYKPNKYEIRYGRPKCGDFDDRTPYSIMKSYHSCLVSGCSVDESITNDYYQYLFDIGETMSVSDQWQYWDAVQEGKIGANTIDNIVWKYSKQGIPAPRPYTTPGGSSGQGGFSPPGQGGFSAPGQGGFPVPPPGLGGFSPPGQDDFAPPPPPGPFEVPGSGSSFGGSQLGSGSSSYRCGYAFKSQGGGPCRPDKRPGLPFSRHCPYNPPSVPRFAPLKGSFQGCCDINLCYISRSDIRELHSGPAPYLSLWSVWSACSVTCGIGVQKRTRTCIGGNMRKCEDAKLVDTRRCRESPCASWSRWGEWNPPCVCIEGLPLSGQTRRRECLPRGGNCGNRSDGMQSRTCKRQWC